MQFNTKSMQSYIIFFNKWYKFIKNANKYVIFSYNSSKIF